MSRGTINIGNVVDGVALRERDQVEFRATEILLLGIDLDTVGLFASVCVAEVLCETEVVFLSTECEGVVRRDKDPVEFGRIVMDVLLTEADGVTVFVWL